MVRIGNIEYDMKALHPAVLPLSSIYLGNPLPVRSLRKTGSLEKGKDYFVSHVLEDGLVILIGQPGQYYKMRDFVQLLETVETRDIVADNDNGGN